MALERFIPKSPDANIRNGQDFEVAKFGHLNTIVEYINNNSAKPAGLNGYVQFNNNNALGGDAGLFWDNVNKRLGVGTVTPGAVLEIYGGVDTLGISGPANQAKSIQIARYNNSSFQSHYIGDDGGAFFGAGLTISASGSNSQIYLQVSAAGRNVNIGSAGQTLLPKDLGARLGVRGSGSTSATTALLVQNSAGSTNFQITDDGQVSIPPKNAGNISNLVINAASLTNSTSVGIDLVGGQFAAQLYIKALGATTPGFPSAILGKSLIQSPSGLVFTSNNAGALSNTDIAMYIYQSKSVHINGFTEVASAILNVESTTKGFLAPRMTTVQRDAIVSPATGLQIFNTNLGTLDIYDGTGWDRFGSQTLIRGVGTTAATTSLLTQNSAGTTTFSVGDDGNILVGANTIIFNNNANFNKITSNFGGVTFDNDGVGSVRCSFTNGRFSTNDKVGFGAYNNTSSRVLILGSGSTSATTSLLVQNSLGNQLGAVNDDGKWMIGTGTPLFQLDVVNDIRARGSLYFGTAGSYLFSDTNNIRLYDKNNTIILQSFPTGVANSETYLQSSSGGKFIRLNDNGINLEWFNSNSSSSTQKPINIIRGFFGNVTATDKTVLNITTPFFSNLTNATTLTGILIDINDTTTYTGFTTVRAIQSLRGGAYFNTTTPQASSVLQADSTTQGFLPPRMTTAQKNAIATPAAGLVIYDTDLNKLCVYTTTWQTITSV